MRTEILTVGAEILAGDIQDTNFRELAALFAGRGLSVTGHATVPDEEERIAHAVRDALTRADLVLVTGGLGPTPDDRTREGIALALGLPQVRREDLLDDLRAIYAALGRAEFPDSNLRQLDLPEGAEALPNPVGTAPGFSVDVDGRLVAAVPGIPREMRRMVNEQLLPRIEARFTLPVIRNRVLRTQGIGESDLVERLRPVMDGWRGVGVAFYPHLPGVDLKLTHLGKDLRDIEGRLDKAEASARSVLGSLVYGTGTQSVAEVVGEALVERGWRVATAESCTGGAVAAELVSVPGASRYVERGVVAYANQAKVDLLGVPAELIEEHGAVSEAVARAMAEGLRKRSGVDVVIATTGIAGPDGGTTEKPVGLVYTAVAAPDGTRCWQVHNAGTRAMVIRRTVIQALNRLRLVVLGER